MTTGGKTRKRRGTRATSPRDFRACEFCGQLVHRKVMTAHLQYNCAGVAAVQDSDSLAPGSTIGVGIEAKKKPWMWDWLEARYPRHLWVNAIPQDNPPGGITWNGLHVELVTDAQNPGCFLVKGRGNWVYSRTIPPPHWDIYQEHLRSRGMRSGLGGIGDNPLLRVGEEAPLAFGPLEPERAIDTETGQTYEIGYDAEGKVVLR